MRTSCVRSVPHCRRRAAPTGRVGAARPCPGPFDPRARSGAGGMVGAREQSFACRRCGASWNESSSPAPTTRDPGRTAVDWAACSRRLPLQPSSTGCRPPAVRPADLRPRARGRPLGNRSAHTRCGTTATGQPERGSTAWLRGRVGDRGGLRGTGRRGRADRRRPRRRTGACGHVPRRCAGALGHRRGPAQPLPVRPRPAPRVHPVADLARAGFGVGSGSGCHSMPRGSPEPRTTAAFPVLALLCAVRQSWGTTATGAVAWCRTAWVTGPMWAPTEEWRMRRPTTTREASREASIKREDGLP